MESQVGAALPSGDRKAVAVQALLCVVEPHLPEYGLVDVGWPGLEEKAGMWSMVQLRDPGAVKVKLPARCGTPSTAGACQGKRHQGGVLCGGHRIRNV